MTEQTPPRLPVPGTKLGPAKHALAEYVRAVKADAPPEAPINRLGIQGGLFQVMALVADLGELYATGRTAEGTSEGWRSADSMLETARLMLAAKHEQGELELDAPLAERPELPDGPEPTP